MSKVFHISTSITVGDKVSVEDVLSFVKILTSPSEEMHSNGRLPITIVDAGPVSITEEGNIHPMNPWRTCDWFGK